MMVMMMEISLFNVLLSTTSSKLSCLQPVTTEPAFFIGSLSLLVSLAERL